MTEQKEWGKTSVGMTANIEAALSYVLGIITGIIFYVIEKDNKFVRFHAMQSILFCGVWIIINVILAIIPLAGWVVAGIVNIVGTIFWLIALFKAFSGEEYKLPLIGNIAEKNI